ncbi:hypothetical protein [Leptolyngbya ohadii]|uniref:hypothetical protein n=1 Tax=Leptolyngbya ohadii TaxID=1962290 RepID=UPI000B5A122D|nr:hypothetical protein [Leptolyngbya ohadii]
MKPNRLFSENYKIDRSTNLYMIEVGLDQYEDIFNEWDPAPFKRREIDSDLRLYLEESSDEIPFQYSIELCFIIPVSAYDSRIEAEARKGLINSFAFKLHLLRRQIRQTNVQMLRFVVLGFIFLAAAAIFNQKDEETIILSTLTEGVFIAGWVFLWEAVSLFFFTNRELYHRYQTYRRIQAAPVVFQTVEKPLKFPLMSEP